MIGISETQSSECGEGFFNAILFIVTSQLVAMQWDLSCKLANPMTDEESPVVGPLDYQVISSDNALFS